MHFYNKKTLIFHNIGHVSEMKKKKKPLSFLLIFFKHIFNVYKLDHGSQIKKKLISLYPGHFMCAIFRELQKILKKMPQYLNN